MRKCMLDMTSRTRGGLAFYKLPLFCSIEAASEIWFLRHICYSGKPDSAFDLHRSTAHNHYNQYSTALCMIYPKQLFHVCYSSGSSAVDMCFSKRIHLYIKYTIKKV